MINEFVKTMLILLLLAASTFAVASIIRLIVDIVNRVRLSDLTKLQEENGNLRRTNRVQSETIANLAAENITVRGINLCISAENEGLAKENGDLMKGTPVVHSFVGMRIYK